MRYQEQDDRCDAQLLKYGGEPSFGHVSWGAPTKKMSFGGLDAHPSKFNVRAKYTLDFETCSHFKYSIYAIVFVFLFGFMYHHRVFVLCHICRRTPTGIHCSAPTKTTLAGIPLLCPS